MVIQSVFEKTVSDPLLLWIVNGGTIDPVMGWDGLYLQNPSSQGPSPQEGGVGRRVVEDQEKGDEGKAEDCNGGNGLLGPAPSIVLPPSQPVLWAVTSMDSVPPGSILINPQVTCIFLNSCASCVWERQTTTSSTWCLLTDWPATSQSRWELLSFWPREPSPICTIQFCCHWQPGNLWNNSRRGIQGFCLWDPIWATTTTITRNSCSHEPECSRNGDTCTLSSSSTYSDNHPY